MIVYAVSRVGLDDGGRVASVLWGEVDVQKNEWRTGESISPVEDVVRAIRGGDLVFALFPSVHGHLPDRRFIAIDYGDAQETIALDGDPTFEREVHDMDKVPS